MYGNIGFWLGLVGLCGFLMVCSIGLLSRLVYMWLGIGDFFGL